MKRGSIVTITCGISMTALTATTLAVALGALCAAVGRAMRAA